MEKDRQAKIITIVALFIGVATLTLGFSIYSSQLSIQSKAKVTPNIESFKVALSKEPDKETVGTITPLGDGEEATISNTGDSVISGLKANFVNPGEKVVYEFYAVNIGDLDAYLNKIEYANVASSTENKVCTADEGTSASLVTTACNSIRITVKVDEDDTACQTSTYGAHTLSKKTGEKVVVTIEYDKSGAVADGSFNVEFGDITLNYSATDTETKNVPSCATFNTEIVGDFDALRKLNVIDNDNDGKISLSDRVTLGTESFYVMSTDERAGTVTMLAEWNLNVGNNTVEGTTGMQNELCKGKVSDSDNHCTVAFSSRNYWASITSYPAWVYNENNDIVRPLVDAYVDKLKVAGYSSVTGRLIKYEELVSLGCTTSGSTCNSAPSWVKNTSFWSGSVDSSSNVWHVGTNGGFVISNYSRSSTFNGVRPVITIDVSEI